MPICRIHGQVPVTGQETRFAATIPVYAFINCLRASMMMFGFSQPVNCAAAVAYSVLFCAFLRTK